MKSDLLLSSTKKVLLFIFLSTVFFNNSFAMSKKILEDTDKVLAISVYYKERIVLPNNSIVTVYLEDISKADAQSKILSSDTLKNIKTPPYKFNLSYDSSLIKENHNYSIRATITLGDRLLFTSTRVINPFEKKDTEDIRVLVQSAKRANSNVNLMDTHWSLLQVGDTKVGTLKMRSFPFVFLESTKPNIKGLAGCNSFFGTYEHNKDTLSFGPLGSTQMMCPDELMQIEFEFLQLLSSDVGWRIKGESLELTNYKTGTKAYLKRKVDEAKVQYLCDKDEQLEVLYDKKDKTKVSVYYKNQTISMKQHKVASGVKYIALDEQNSYRWNMSGDEGILGFLKADHTAREEVLLRCNKK